MSTQNQMLKVALRATAGKVCGHFLTAFDSSSIPALRKCLIKSWDILYAIETVVATVAIPYSFAM